MESSLPTVTTCRFCSHYDPQGRRGGECRRLGVPVRGYWRACPLAVSAFSPSHQLTPSGIPGVRSLVSQIQLPEFSVKSNSEL